MKLAIKIIISALAVVITASILPGIQIHGISDLSHCRTFGEFIFAVVKNYPTALLVAMVLLGLNTFVKPILVFLTLPVTIITMGLFLLVINSVIVLMMDYFIDSIDVAGFWWALIFSLVLSIVTSIMEKLGGKQKK